MGRRGTTERLRDEYSMGAPGHVLEAQYYYYGTRNDSQGDLAIVYGGQERCAADFEIQRRSYPFYVLEFPLRGRCRLVIEGRVHELRRGVVAGFAPGQRHHYRCDPRRPLEHYFVAFEGDLAANLMERSGLAAAGAATLYDVPHALRLVRTITALGHRQHPHAQELSCCYLRALLLEQASHVATQHAVRSTARSTFERCRRYLNENFSTLRSPRDVADSVGIDVRYLASLFKRFGEAPPHDCLMQLKLNRAANLLLNSDAAVCVIGAMVGFDDPYHFSRRFKAYFGLSPQHFRARHMDAGPSAETSAVDDDRLIS